MKRYCIRCSAGKVEYFDVINETEDGFDIRLTKLSDGNEKVINQYMSKALFDMCLKTSYIYELEQDKQQVA